MNYKEIQFLAYRLFSNVVYYPGDTNILERMMQLPFIFDRVENWDEEVANAAIEAVSENSFFGDGKTFYPTWKKMLKAEKSGKRVLDQLIHYARTYGGYDVEDQLTKQKDIEVLYKNVKIIKVIDKPEFKRKVVEVVNNQKTIESDLIETLAEVISYFNLNTNPVSKELRVVLILKGMLQAESAEEELRAIIYALTNETMLIKSKKLIELINIAKGDQENSVATLLLQNNIYSHAEIFNRFKPIYLALKTEDNKRVINKISKLSKTLHKPKKEPEYQKVGELDLERFEEAISALDTPYLVKIWHYLKKRGKHRVFVIRNGAIFITSDKKSKIKNRKKKIKLLKEILTQKIQKNIDKYDLALPSNEISYAIPLSGKQFVSNIPFGSRIEIKKAKAIYAGIEWRRNEELTEPTSIDIDISATSIKGKVGWNSLWGDEHVLYSGDVTEANPVGSEVLKFSSLKSMPMQILRVNNYSNAKDFIFFVSKKKIKMSFNPKIDLSKVHASTKLTFDKDEMILGVVDSEKFVFTSLAAKSSRVSTDIEMEEVVKAIDNLNNSYPLFCELDLKYGNKEAASVADMMKFVES